MSLPRAWRKLHRSRFPEIPEDCGNDSNPGVLDLPEFRDWSRRHTTDDQHRIEAYIDRFDLTGKRLWHVGIGNSGLARRFSRRLDEIVGSSIEPNEIDRGRSEALRGYIPILHNKFGDQPDLIPGQFDFIVDNNPTSFCCCMTHLAALFDLYSKKLGDRGQIVTDRHGLGWTPETGNRLFRFEFDDLEAIAALAGFSTHRVTRQVYVLARGQPPKAGLMSTLRHAVRQAVGAPSRMTARVDRAFRRAVPSRFRRLVHKLLPSTLNGR